MDTQRSINEAATTASLQQTVPFCCFSQMFKRKMSQCIEQRRVVRHREAFEGTNLENLIIILKSGLMEIQADVEIFPSNDRVSCMRRTKQLGEVFFYRNLRFYYSKTSHLCA